MIHLHPNELSIRLDHQNPELRAEAERLGPAYVHAWKEQNRRQNAIYLASIEQNAVAT